MKKILFNCLCVLLIVISVVLMGCSSLLDHVTPAWPDSEIEEYLTAPIVPGDENYCQQEDLKATPVMPYTTLADVKKQRRMIGYKHEDRQQCFKDALRDDKVSYGRTFESIVRSIEDAQSLQDNVEHGFGGIGGPAIIGMAGIGGLAWNRRKPGDVSKADAEKAQQDAVDKAVADANAAADEVRNAFKETVAGVQSFIEHGGSESMADSLKRLLADKQSYKTREMVANAKAGNVTA